METGELMSQKIAVAVQNVQNLTQEEIDALWAEAMDFIKTLPKEKRGGFYWRSGLECLFLFTSESKGDKT